jgi:hypothetical protein
MREQVGCRDLAAAVLAAMMIPWLVTHCFGGWVRAGRALAGRATAAPGAPGAAPPASLEAWVRLRSYRGCPLLAAASGYRLGLHCRAGGRSDGTLAFAGPFAGRAYLSARPAPLGRWFHVAGLDPGTASGLLSSAPPAPLILLDGADVTAGRAMGALPPLPLGRDPWPAAARPATADGELGAWRFSRRPRTVAEVAAGRGAPGRLAPLPARSDADRGLAVAGSAAGATGAVASGPIRRGWLLAGVCLTAALLLVALALCLPARTAAPPRALGSPHRRGRRQGALP